jgi:hypothetical protein
VTRPETKQKDEGAEAFEAFAKYRDMGVARSTAAVGRELGKSKALMDRWSSAHNWVKRAHSYDLDLDRRKRLGDLRAVETMRKRQTTIALRVQALAMTEIEKMLNEALSKSERGELDAKEVAKLLELGTKLERLNRGEPGEIVQNQVEGGLDLSGLSSQELRELRLMRAKLRALQLAADESAAKDESD